MHYLRPLCMGLFFHFRSAHISCFNPISITNNSSQTRKLADASHATINRKPKDDLITRAMISDVRFLFHLFQGCRPAQSTRYSWISDMGCFFLPPLRFGASLWVATRVRSIHHGNHSVIGGLLAHQIVFRILVHTLHMLL
jgi:hypothetical protein